MKSQPGLAVPDRPSLRQLNTEIDLSLNQYQQHYKSQRYEIITSQPGLAVPDRPSLRQLNTEIDLLLNHQTD